MTSRLTSAFYVTVLGAALFASSTPAQVRGTRGSGRGPRTGVSFRLGGRAGEAHPGQRQYFIGSRLEPFPYLYPDYGFDYESAGAEAPPVQLVVAPPAQPPAPAARPVESLLLENHGGQWVRVPTGSGLQALSQSAPTDSVQASNQVSNWGPEIAGRKETARPLPTLPRAVLVFRDGHQEEVAKYIIQGDFIYADADYWNTGSWTRRISIAELDVAATLKLNEERGGKFNLPSGPNEVMVRF